MGGVVDTLVTDCSKKFVQTNKQTNKQTKNKQTTNSATSAEMLDDVVWEQGHIRVTHKPNLEEKKL